ncbi:hypothetical protein SDC9_75424 [bioreactor metagenome]|uniref:Uncharacterized protein n=1 Tax=bioreactor metagenome TaxID=1076179 RepID=A0A644YKQ1_9ZZZZ
MGLFSKKPPEHPFATAKCSFSDADSVDAWALDLPFQFNEITPVNTVRKRSPPSLNEAPLSELQS